MSNSAAQIKQHRRTIINGLNMMYPSGMCVRSILNVVITVDPTYDDDLLRKDLTYLKERGFIQFIDDTIGGLPFAEKIVKLTTGGKDIADQITNEPTLEI